MEPMTMQPDITKHIIYTIQRLLDSFPHSPKERCNLYQLRLLATSMNTVLHDAVNYSNKYGYPLKA